MRALIVYESMFGNTGEVATAVARGLSDRLEVELRDVSEAPSPITEFLDLIVVGGPTHAFSMSRENTRSEAVRQGARRPPFDLGLREWLEALPSGNHEQAIATFDTRVDKVRHLPGSAAKGAAKLARRHGYRAAAHHESFYVQDTQGPLLPGELDRATAWGRRLAQYRVPARRP